MNPRSLRQGARVPIVGVVLAVGLILDPGGLSSLGAQEPSPKGAGPKVKAPAAMAPAASLRAQKLKTRKARVAYEIARLNRERAEIAVEEFPEVTYVQELATIEGEIKLAVSDLERSEDRLAWARRMFAKGFVSKATCIAEELNLQKARYTLEQAQSKKKVLVEYTRAKTIKALRVDLDKARKDEADKKAAWESEVIQQAELERQLDRT